MVDVKLEFNFYNLQCCRWRAKYFQFEKQGSQSMKGATHIVHFHKMYNIF